MKSFFSSLMLLGLTSAAVCIEDALRISDSLIKARFKGMVAIHHATTELSESEMSLIIESTDERPDDGRFDFFSIRIRDSLAGFAVLDSVNSKSSTLSFLLITDAAGVISALELLSTPDPRSARLRTSWWPKQFAKKSAIRPRQIDAVSGATVSCNDVVRTVRCALAYIHRYKDRQQRADCATSH